MTGPRTPRNPWDQQPDETGPAWAAFVAYRDMGPTRSLTKLAQSLHRSKQLLGGWSSKNSWQTRVNAWDRDQDKLWQRELGVARRAAAKQNVDLGVALKKIAANSMVKLAQSPAGVKPAELARLLEAAIRLEYAVFGPAPDLVTAGTSATSRTDLGHIGVMSDEERRARMLQLRRVLDARLGPATPDEADHPAHGGTT